MLTDELIYQLELYVAVRYKKSDWSCACVDIDTVEERLRRIKETFSKYLLDFIAVRGLNEVDVYKRANLDRRIFFKLRKQKGYMPSK